VLILSWPDLGEVFFHKQLVTEQMSPLYVLSGVRVIESRTLGSELNVCAQSVDLGGEDFGSGKETSSQSSSETKLWCACTSGLVFFGGLSSKKLSRELSA